LRCCRRCSPRSRSPAPPYDIHDHAGLRSHMPRYSSRVRFR
jgi:hypothetical protein